MRRDLTCLQTVSGRGVAASHRPPSQARSLDARCGDRGQAKIGVVVVQRNKPIYRIPYTSLVKVTGRASWFFWKPPARFRDGVLLTFCVSAIDAADNRASDCANVSVLEP